MTYSILARDRVTGHLAVACQSHFFGAGRIANWAQAGVGVVATQAFANVDFGPEGLAALAQGTTAQAAVDALIEMDPDRDYRQLAILDSHGGIGTFTGERCVEACGALAGEDVVVQGNMLTDTGVLESMLDAYRRASGALADRVVAALRAAENAGGDARGSQSAGVKVVGPDPSDKPWREVIVDLNVDDHTDPVGELERLLPLQGAFGVVGGILFAPGLMLGPFDGAQPEALDQALAELEDAAAVIGKNQEAAFWRAVLLARASKTDLARQAFGQVFGLAPHLRPYLRSVAKAGFLEDADVFLA